ncbi:MAG: ADOP family duplicated permease [Gemmatimonadaceae bacterium]
MSRLDGWRYRLRVLLSPRRHAADLDEEIAFHLDLDARQHASAAGAEDHWAARRRFGNVTYMKEQAREMAGIGFLEVLRQDLRFASRSFRRTPGFTAIVVLTLAVGIGANTAIFSAVNALLLRPLPFHEPQRLAQPSLTSPASPDEPARDDRIWSFSKAVAFAEAQTAFEAPSVYTSWESTVRGDDAPERVTGEFTDSRYLPTLGVQPALGRNFTADEDRVAGGPRVVLISDSYWQRRFNADPAVLGQTLDLDGQPYTIIGVMPRDFRGLTGKAEFWASVRSLPADELAGAWSHFLMMVARLRPGMTMERAIAESQRAGTVVDARYPHPEVADEHWGATARPLDATRVDPMVRRSLLVLLGAVAVVLLIACANVANLFLVRAAGRRREIAVRLAVGARRGRLVRQLLTESALLAGLGGVAGVVVAWWGVRLLSALDPSTALRAQRLQGLGAVGFDAIRLDLPTLAVAAAITVITGLLFGLAPALQSTRPSLTGALKEEQGASRTGGRGPSTRNMLAVAEIALAVVLLAGSGLMLRSLGKLMGVEPGFDSSQVLTLRLNLDGSTGRDSLPASYDVILQRLAGLPGVTSVAFGDCPPLNGWCNGTVLLHRDRPAPAPGTEHEVGVHWVTQDWFATLDVPLRRGRLFNSGDRLDTRKVVLINESAASRYWPDEDPLGRPVSVGQGGFWEDTAYVVGVVGDVRYGTVDSLPGPDVYLSYHQSPNRRATIYLRSAADPLALAGAARQALGELLPGTPVYDVRTLASRVADASAYARFSALLLGLFAAVALGLAVIGTYGVIAYSVAQRDREIGVRLALGATAGNVTRLVVGQGMGIAAAGAALGVAGALAATRVLGSLLYDVAPNDPATFAAIVALLVGAVLVASWIPARRAARVHPGAVLRS